ncbi:uncharacterized protein EV154DRAFT_485099 [Mucor mucedo]|uniref:uncharacterized protein n=1 Tax=Mucor mucedo TaxID=29922 RepID=UPI00221FEF4E|nr:uncharacterized protein EV154DRAFT_485099 [Mucor mucedo]KAI7886551.1 hypothetical protein EV154DRAFT_485099 [Mucor mucedo]
MIYVILSMVFLILLLVGLFLSFIGCLVNSALMTLFCDEIPSAVVPSSLLCHVVVFHVVVCPVVVCPVVVRLVVARPASVVVSSSLVAPSSASPVQSRPSVGLLRPSFASSLSGPFVFGAAVDRSSASIFSSSPGGVVAISASSAVGSLPMFSADNAFFENLADQDDVKSDIIKSTLFIQNIAIRNLEWACHECLKHFLTRCFLHLKALAENWR